MRARSELHDILIGIVGAGRVYFQPPESTRIDYPCVVYSRAGVESEFADNVRYSSSIRYDVTLISPRPDSELFEKLLDLPFCSHNRHYVVNRLYHDTFTLYF